MARSSESDGSGFSETPTIEEYLARKDPYRAVAHGTPIPHPFNKRRSPDILADLADRLESEVIRIVSSSQITVEDVSLYLCRPRHPGGNNISQNILFITTRDEKPLDNDWRAASRAVHSLFTRNGLATLHLDSALQVEIRNPSLYYHDISRCLPNDPALLNLLEEKKDAISDIVVTELRDVLTAVCFHGRLPFSMRFAEYEGKTCEPKATVVIYCRSGLASANFGSAEDRITQLFEGADSEVHVELLPGDLTAASTPAGNVDMGVGRYYSAIPKDLVNGSSISVKGRKESGSLGGWCLLNIPNRQPIKCMITCYHVVRALDENTTRQTDSNGITIDGGPGHVDIVYPAELDRSTTVDYIKNLREDGRLEDADTAETALAAVLQRGPIGRVLCGSGRRLQDSTSGPHFRLDWALVESPETFAPNKPPTTDDMSSPHKQLARPDKKVYWKPNADFRAREIGSIRKDDWVGFRGRSTPIGSGEANKIKPRVFWPEANKFSDEWEIFPVGVGSSEFNSPGDSGAMVFNSEGQIVGLNMMKVDEAGYVTTIDTIQKDVRKLTGGFLSFDY
ncbi:hypothetical protein FQN50_005648 [Emmonsiellopsis sp. PD_5]|nr:hypothetical protein FQN50_005648 [Emmonsiellopsis sp. PD_5]